MSTFRLFAVIFALVSIGCVSGLNLRVTIDPSDELQQIFNGFWEQAGQSDPTTVLSCFPGDSPQLTVNFFADLTAALANSQYLKVPAIVANYKKGIPDSVVPCLNSNPEAVQVAKAYGTYQIKLTDLFAKVEKYVVAHIESVHDNFVQLNTELEAGNYNIYGRDAGVLLFNIMNNSQVMMMNNI